MRAAQVCNLIHVARLSSFYFIASMRALVLLLLATPLFADPEQVQLEITAARKNNSIHTGTTDGEIQNISSAEKIVLTIHARCLIKESDAEVLWYFIGKDLRTQRYFIASKGSQQVHLSKSVASEIVAESENILRSENRMVNWKTEKNGQVPIGWVVIALLNGKEGAIQASTDATLIWFRKNPPKLDLAR